jgi:hypothetical protein
LLSVIDEKLELIDFCEFATIISRKINFLRKNAKQNAPQSKALQALLMLGGL